MKQILEKQVVFSGTLSFLAFLAQRPRLQKTTAWFTSRFAQLNLYLNKPAQTKELHSLANQWKALMPPDGQENFKVKEVTEDTAFTEIHLKCPLRGSGNVEACYELMNYDRKLMDAVGGTLIVLESQSNSGKDYCSLAIRPKGASIEDLTPAHKKA